MTDILLLAHQPEAHGVALDRTWAVPLALVLAAGFLIARRSQASGRSVLGHLPHDIAALAARLRRRRPAPRPRPRSR